MDPSGVLLALEEQRKWRERRERIKDRMRQLRRRRAYLGRELDRVREKMAEHRDLVAGQTDQPVPDWLITPPMVR